MVFQAGSSYYKELNAQIRASDAQDIIVENVNGQRYLGCGTSGRHFTLYGTPGNGLGQYLNGSVIEVLGNAQEATGDTMNAGRIIIHGSCGDAAGYGMRGGCIFIKNDCGYRGGIHMKAYQDQHPVLVIGGKAGSFLGEYQAGGLILVLGIGASGQYPASFYCGTGMHGGKIILRCDEAPFGLPRQVMVREADAQALAEIAPYIQDYCKYFGGDAQTLCSQKYFVLSPNPDAGYHQLYTYE